MPHLPRSAVRARLLARKSVADAAHEGEASTLTPHVTTILTGVFVAVFAAFMNINEAVELTNIGTLFAFVLVAAGVIVLRAREPDRPRPLRVPWSPFVPLTAIGTCLYLMLELPLVTWFRVGVWLALGLMIYASYGYKRSRLGR